ncbi:MAG TPA: YcxB family protein [Acholeplasmataceae bacterium]|nr:YcxB family protein [Acholeplasmataceae bacterium]
MNIKAKMTHSEDKARDFFKFHLTKKSSSRNVYFGLAIILFIAAIGFLFLSQLYYALFFTFVALMLLVIRRVMINMTVNRIIKKLRLLDYSYQIKFLDEKLIYETTVSSKEYQYQNLFGISETKTCFYLYVSKNAAIIILKSALNPEDRTELERFLRQKTGYRLYRYK